MNFQEDLDFEISFYKAWVDENPQFSDALIALGDAYTKQGRYKEGLEVDLKLAKLKPKDETVHYNLACSYSLLSKATLCLKALEKAIKLGYKDFDYMQQDADLAFIRKDPRYEKLISRYEKNSRRLQNRKRSNLRDR